MSEVQDLRAKLEQMQADTAAIEAAIEAATQADLDRTRQAVDDLIRDSGFSRAEVLGQPAEEVSEEVASDRRTFPRFVLQSDPSKVYARGRLPNWLKAAMIQAGANPELAADRRAFRAEHMVEQAS